jgi:site-specific DNA-cytosine methylase
MRLLELFSGTGSVRKAVGNQFEEVISLDILPKFNPTQCCNILEWNYAQYPRDYFYAIWASPPCTEYSRLKNNTHMNTNLDVADTIVQRTLEIINYFQPTKWFLENPQTGLLKTRLFMQGLPYYDVDYCRFSNWGYKKRTRIWTNVLFKNSLCMGEGVCPNMIGKYHKVSFGGQGRPKPHTYTRVPAGENAYKIPQALIQDLFASNI